MLKLLSITVVAAALTVSLNIPADEMHGDSPAIAKMADILMRLHHRPDADGKRVLNQIVNDSGTSATDRTLAQALLDVEHHVNPSDKGPLNKIVNDPNASQHEKDLADIILNLNHEASDSDKEKLHDMM
jgi:hypothetical protein